MDIKLFCTVGTKLTNGRKSYYIHCKEKENLCCAPPQRANGTTVDGVLGSLQAPAGGVR
jgi:hypothetical protein